MVSVFAVSTKSYLVVAVVSFVEGEGFSYEKAKMLVTISNPTPKEANLGVA